MRGALKALPDIGRALGRVAIGRGSPRDLGQLRDGLNEARLLRERMGRLPDMPALMAELLPLLDGHGALIDLLSRSEEHTSELQSLMRISYAVFCLKKKTPQCNNDRIR